MYLLNGRITPFKRLFSLKCSSKQVSKQNFHESLVNLDKDDSKSSGGDKKSENKKSLKKFSFIQLKSEPITKSTTSTTTLQKHQGAKNEKLHIKQEAKEEPVVKKSSSVVDTLVSLINRLEPDKTAKKLFEPVENLRSKELRKQENYGKTNALTQNKRVKADAAPTTQNADKSKEKESKKEPSTQIQKAKTTGTSAAENSRKEFNNKFRNAIQEIKSNQYLKLAGGSLSTNVFENVHALNSGTGLNLFENGAATLGESRTAITHESPVWEMYYNEELNEAQEVPPINGFDEMIKLTNEGKMWNFPIDNEQDHVFLENYLEQFPDITAVQEFMTLVLNGLSKNSHLSIEEKRGIISWYRNYFTEKQPLIEEALNAERLEQEYHAKLEMQKSQMAGNQSKKGREELKY